MKILGIDDFLKLPIGTIFTFYEPYSCHGLHIKRDTIANSDGPADFYYSTISPQCINANPPEIDHTPMRWGEFDYDAEFAVCEPSDIEKMVESLTQIT